MRWYAAIFALAVTVSMLASSFIVAQSNEDVTLSISPQIIELSANPGDPAIVNVIRLTNGSDLPIEIETIPKNILPTGEEGAVDLTEDGTSYSLAEWITVSPSVLTMSPRSTEDFTITINVPPNAEPGGKFGTVVFKTIPPEAEGANAASVSQEIAPVILANVAGDVIEEANIASFGATKSFWSNEDTISFDSRVENTGSVYFRPKGTITIKNMFGSEVTTIPLEEKNVLPESIRRISADWNDTGFAVGRYTADLSLVYGESDTILVSSTSFTVFPYQTLLPVILIGGLVLIVLVKFRSRVSAAVKVLSGK
jgi:hypothetical protein